jgi:tripartite-type tricarboxylate transporter receptor subunit TctC
VVVDNRGGASGRIAGAAAARATPDGYTLFFTYGGVLTTGLPLFRKLPFDPIHDFAPVAMMAHVPGILVAHPSFPAKTVAELIKLAKSKPGALTHGSSSIATTSHLNMGFSSRWRGSICCWFRIPVMRRFSSRSWAVTCNSHSVTWSQRGRTFSPAS